MSVVNYRLELLVIDSGCGQIIALPWMTIKSEVSDPGMDSRWSAHAASIAKLPSPGFGFRKSFDRFTQVPARPSTAASSGTTLVLAKGEGSASPACGSHRCTSVKTRRASRLYHHDEDNPWGMDEPS